VAGAFEIRPLTIPIYVVARVGRRGDEEVRGYALAIGWRPEEGGPEAPFDAGGHPEVSYLVADPSRQRPTWVSETAVQSHFRTFLSGVPEPPLADDSTTPAGPERRP
jgi:hypothetical protein